MGKQLSSFSAEKGADAIPAVSVVMPARNTAKFIDEAISSIVNQTFTDFEFIICDDASTDRTPEKIAAWAAKDDRIRAFYSDTNLGPAKAANWTVSLARAPIIVRMDADDISELTRVEKQHAVLQSHPDIVLFGSLYEGMDRDSRKIYGRDRSTLLRREFRLPCGHATAIFRTEALRQIGGYREACDFWEDFDMIYRMAAIGKVCFGTESLFHYRHSRAHARVNVANAKVEEALDLHRRCLKQFARTGEYESVIAADQSAPSDRVSPDVLLAIAKLHTLAGNRHRLLRRFLTRAQLLPFSKSAAVLVKLIAARIAPKSIRAVQARMRARNDKQVDDLFTAETIVEWHWSKHHPEKRKEAAKSSLPSPDPSLVG